MCVISKNMNFIYVAVKLLIVLYSSTIQFMSSAPCDISSQFDAKSSRIEFDENAAESTTLFELPFEGSLVDDIDSIAFKSNELNDTKLAEYFALSSKTLTLRKAYDLDVVQLDLIELLFSCTSKYNASSPIYRNTFLLYITINDINNKVPQFLATPYSFAIKELTPVGTVVYQNVKAVDNDLPNKPNSQISYSIERGGAACSEFFEFPLTTMSEIAVSKLIRYELFAECLLTIKVEDHGSPQLSSTTTIRIEIIDEDDKDPAFTKSYYTAQLRRNSPQGSVINITDGNLFAEDQDTGINMTIRYSLSSNPGDLFEINSTSGDLYLKDPINDYDKTEYNLVVKATQVDNELRSALTMLHVLIVDVNERAPVFERATYEASVPENSRPDTVLCVVRATDADNNRVEYSILNNHEAPFTIDKYRGVVRVSGRLDYEMRSHYTLDVVASDAAFTDTASVHVAIVNIVDKAPHFEQAAYTFRIKLPYDVYVGQVRALDIENTDNVRYALHAASANHTGLFCISPTGVIFICSSNESNGHSVSGSGGSGTVAVDQQIVRQFDESAYRFNVSASIYSPSLRRYLVSRVECRVEVELSPRSSSPALGDGQLNATLRLQPPLLMQQPLGKSSVTALGALNERWFSEMAGKLIVVAVVLAAVFVLAISVIGSVWLRRRHRHNLRHAATATKRRAAKRNNNNNNNNRPAAHQPPDWFDHLARQQKQQHQQQQQQQQQRRGLDADCLANTAQSKQAADKFTPFTFVSSLTHSNSNNNDDSSNSSSNECNAVGSQMTFATTGGAANSCTHFSHHSHSGSDAPQRNSDDEQQQQQQRTACLNSTSAMSCLSACSSTFSSREVASQQQRRAVKQTAATVASAKATRQHTRCSNSGHADDEQQQQHSKSQSPLYSQWQQQSEFVSSSSCSSCECCTSIKQRPLLCNGNGTDDDAAGVSAAMICDATVAFNRALSDGCSPVSKVTILSDYSDSSQLRVSTTHMCPSHKLYFAPGPTVVPSVAHCKMNCSSLQLHQHPHPHHHHHHQLSEECDDSVNNNSNNNNKVNQLSRPLLIRQETACDIGPQTLQLDRLDQLLCTTTKQQMKHSPQLLSFMPPPPPLSMSSQIKKQKHHESESAHNSLLSIKSRNQMSTGDGCELPASAVHFHFGGGGDEAPVGSNLGGFVNMLFNQQEPLSLNSEMQLDNESSLSVDRTTATMPLCAKQNENENDNDDDDCDGKTSTVVKLSSFVAPYSAPRRLSDNDVTALHRSFISDSSSSSSSISGSSSSSRTSSNSCNESFLRRIMSHEQANGGGASHEKTAQPQQHKQLRHVLLEPTIAEMDNDTSLISASVDNSEAAESGGQYSNRSCSVASTAAAALRALDDNEDNGEDDDHNNNNNNNKTVLVVRVESDSTATIPLTCITSGAVSSANVSSVFSGDPEDDHSFGSVNSRDLLNSRLLTRGSQVRPGSVAPPCALRESAFL